MIVGGAWNFGSQTLGELLISFYSSISFSHRSEILLIIDAKKTLHVFVGLMTCPFTAFAP